MSAYKMSPDLVNEPNNRRSLGLPQDLMHDASHTAAHTPEVQGLACERTYWEYWEQGWFPFSVRRLKPSSMSAALSEARTP